jgi:hypothetical protein
MEDGKWYCGIHLPSAVKVRQEKRRAVANEKWQSSIAKAEGK